MQQCYQNFIIPYFKWSSACFGRHTAHHQEPKTAQAASGFAAYAAWQRPTTARPTTFHVCKTRGCLCSFRLLMMGCMSPKICWASFKIRNNKILITLLHLVGFFTVRIELLQNPAAWSRLVTVIQPFVNSIKVKVNLSFCLIIHHVGL